ncbi:helix-turn-helix domain-containing protein [Clostridium kluyveri]|uniref:HTH cro/C1-type domain-containing protein n=1 Tax=Clostridium kluyveri TaxID=1534 RepID=A0A1L5FC85_CLOKL|nr:helix-turn-helix transcriptional regulator [Clostridium kluyveri]APM40587.1 hypothetical protein BS101_18595 [Clostridium kluyveri]
MASFGDRLKELRKKSNLTQQELANKFYLNKSSISRYENDTQLPEHNILEKIADYFNVSIDYLLGRTNIRNTENTYVTPKEHEDIEEVVEELRERLLNTENFKIEGKPATKEDIETILDSVKVGIEMAKIKKRRNHE